MRKPVNSSLKWGALFNIPTLMFFYSMFTIKDNSFLNGLLIIGNFLFGVICIIISVGSILTLYQRAENEKSNNF